jgi:hypothetical protein
MASTRLRAIAARLRPGRGQNVSCRFAQGRNPQTGADQMNAITEPDAFDHFVLSVSRWFHAATSSAAASPWSIVMIAAWVRS